MGMTQTVTVNAKMFFFFFASVDSTQSECCVLVYLCGTVLWWAGWLCTPSDFFSKCKRLSGILVLDFKSTPPDFLSKMEQFKCNLCYPVQSTMKYDCQHQKRGVLMTHLYVVKCHRNYHTNMLAAASEERSGVNRLLIPTRVASHNI